MSLDGTAISANLGVNPSLSITAQAERAAALWPNKGEADQRPAGALPATGPIPPQRPVVPADAPGALRNLPIVAITSGSQAAADHATVVIAPAAEAAPVIVDGNSSGDLGRLPGGQLAAPVRL